MKTPQAWVYIRSEPELWTVGFYAPDGQWHPDSDFSEREQAAKRAAWLNGGSMAWLSEALNEGDGVYRP